MKQKCIVCDIDNTILNTEFILREIYEKGLKGDDKWDYFHANCNSDRVNVFPNIIPFIRGFGDNVVTVILTARNEKVRFQTAKKLWQYKIGFEEMYMRESDDYRPAEDVKKDHLQKIKEKYDIICFVDDNLGNCEMARDLGILALRRV